MKVRLEETGLIITPESYVEQVALKAWSDKSDLSNGGWLVEAYAQHGVQSDLAVCTCQDMGNYIIKINPACKVHGDSPSR